MEHQHAAVSRWSGLRGPYLRVIPVVLATVLATSASALAQTSTYIDSGSPNPITAVGGAQYSADPGPSSQFYDYGQHSNLCNTGNGTVAIAGTQNPKIYQTVRYGQNFSYSIPIQNGCYDISLHFVECSYNQAGQRLTQVQLNGSTLLNNLDVFGEVGAAHANTHNFPGNNITGGAIDLSFRSQIAGENAVVSAVDVAASNNCTAPQPIQHVLLIVFENANAADALAQPFMGGLVNNRDAAYLGNYHAITHPSEPNYIALVAGDTLGVTDDTNHNLNASHLGDLLEAKGLSWKAYAEDYPGNCFTGAQSRSYVRKHNPFISFTNVNTNTARCNAHIVNASQFWTDQQNGQLPAFALYIPNLQHDGHDTSVSFADNWLSSTFGSWFSSNAFWAINPLVIMTFDENEGSVASSADRTNNQVYTALFGNTVANGTISEQNYNHYSLLSLVESIFNLGNLGRNDATATPINDVWD
jgi:hypothetical protein